MRKFLLGAVLTYVGFFLFILGFMISAASIPTLNDMIKAVIPLDMTLIVTIIQVVSGLVGVTGILLCIASVSKPTPAPITIVQQVPVPAPPARAPAQPPASAPAPESASVAKSGLCRFCGHYIEPNETFCPSCNRAQR